MDYQQQDSKLKGLPTSSRKSKTMLRQRLGNSINLLPETVFGQIVGIFSDREAEIWELIEDVYHSQYPDDAEGVSLYNAAALNGIEIIDSAKSVQKNQLLFGDIELPFPSTLSFRWMETRTQNSRLEIR
ncbi:MAG: hypothetical protein IPK68_08950 [Bdellovibrionales bacterium]|nr:hypothetical protein [Bdellovibrionales bacterium]